MYHNKRVLLSLCLIFSLRNCQRLGVLTFRFLHVRGRRVTRNIALLRVPRWCPEHVIYTASNTWLIPVSQITRSVKVHNSIMEIQVLKKFRGNDDPELSKVDGKSIETLSKEELMKHLEQCGINGGELCDLGAIDPRQENLAALLHYALEVKEAQAPGTSGVTAKKPDEEPPAKKVKTTDKSEVS